ncbi:MAG: hypothetical protein K6D02_07880 [Lachnospiraceae bacterium]|nr:hypothetical protein [Lachnospiraceae bacterium]
MKTIKNQLEELNIDIKDSVYNSFGKPLTYPMAAIGSFDVYTNEDDLYNFSDWMRYGEILNDLTANSEVTSLKAEIEEINTKNKTLNKSMKEAFIKGEKPDEKLQEEAKKLRVQKKALKLQLEEIEATITEKCISKCKEEGLTLGKNILRYKKELMLNSYENIRKIFTFLPEDPEMPYFKDMPFYTNNLLGLKEVIDNKLPLAVEGGPCLFGLQEVYVVVTLKDGTEYKFDYNTAHYGPEDTGELGCESLEALVNNQSDMVSDIKFLDYKKGLTRQEYYELLYPFKVAQMFNAKLVLPLPDLSYIKYLDALTANMDSEVREIAMERFRSLCYRISDLMLDKIDEIAKDYPDVEYILVHDRNTEVCNKYYSERKKYMERSKSRDIIKRLTHNKLRQQSILDYVTMPALPLYLYGIKNIIQIDCMNEVDSYRKCRNIHKSGINLFSLLYPEYLSRDGKHTVFYSKREDKDYI